MMLRNVWTPPIANTVAATQTSTIELMTATPRNTASQDLVPTHAEANHIGKRKAIRSGRNPLPTARAIAPHTANCFSPFQHRQQQYAVSNENSARNGRSGPSRLEYQTTGLSKNKSAAPQPAHCENILFPSANATN